MEQEKRQEEEEAKRLLSAMAPTHITVDDLLAMGGGLHEAAFLEGGMWGGEGQLCQEERGEGGAASGSFLK